MRPIPPEASEIPKKLFEFVWMHGWKDGYKCGVVVGFIVPGIVVIALLLGGCAPKPYEVQKAERMMHQIEQERGW